MKLRFAFATFVEISFACSAAWAANSNIEYLAGLPDTKLNLAATIAGNLVGVMKKCPALRLNEDGKAMIAVPVLLYDGIDKHLTPKSSKFKKAIRTYERAFAIAAQRGSNCQAEKARYPHLYR
ncbi:MULTISPECIES: hypothetical protein [unclassified Mesorhizobium]|uniref:hypothetical protein n=1 Tax=unclassified Mesorhizobium TaxID=325217 RepID=UPI001CCBB208|nr:MULTISPECIES: hypothetical protein [unclassified Mesorhizobium]MBZ9861676.1 hypothetical protein [Mesorhizobium sp. CA12]MBZ9867643.1 hypothetical protein [Mesorhizobium sp. CA15]MBZ9911657.1 hypothetical protein [Mesorhizobium sp. CA16]